MSESDERPERSERPERPESSDRPERPEGSERPERPEGSERPERPERPERSGRSPLSDRPAGAPPRGGGRSGDRGRSAGAGQGRQSARGRGDTAGRGRDGAGRGAQRGSGDGTGQRSGPRRGQQPGQRSGEGAGPPRTPRPRRVEPPLPDDVTGAELDRSVRAELGSLASINADVVAKHLAMAGRLLDEDPETAYQHAVAARDRAGRIGAVREAAGIAAYLSGRYAEALAELRAARRISGDQSLLPVMADCERGLGRPEKALAMAAAPEVARLDASGRAEMLIVASGARRDLGQPEAAALMLRGPELAPGRRRPWSARLFYAYAEALLAGGRTEEAGTWFGHAAEADQSGETDADERLAELQGVGPLVVHDDETSDTD